MLTRFILYGMIGWSLEIIWTALGSLIEKDYRLVGRTSIWMFFIYASVIFFEPLCDFLRALPVIVRGGVYVVCFFVIEYATGIVLKRIKICPWDYSHSRFNIKGIIRLDYAPVWFVAGLIFEGAYRILA